MISTGSSGNTTISKNNVYEMARVKHFAKMALGLFVWQSENGLGETSLVIEPEFVFKLRPFKSLTHLN